MYNLKNITLDFSQHSSLSNMVVDQPVAVMPEVLAKKLLQMYAEKLRYASIAEIIRGHIKTLEQFATASDLEGAMNASLTWLTERELINNVAAGNWDAYNVVVDQPINDQTFG